MKKMPQNIIAIVYDFDGTLSPNNMQEDTIFPAYGIDRNRFWKKTDELVAHGYERTLAYLKLLLHDESFKKKPLHKEDLQKLAAKIKFYPGVSNYLDRVLRFMKTVPEVQRWKIELEHYIISSGMKEILDGVEILRNFKKVYACELEYNQAGEAVFPKLVINDTNKTQFLFRISKGKLDLGEDINTHMPEEQRRIPFRNIIYVGDSDTDVPSMTVVQKYEGHAIAVFDPAKGRPEKAMRMVKDKRVDHFAPADFSENSLLTKILYQTIRKIIHTIVYYSSADKAYQWVKSHGEGESHEDA
jgi:phosphoserine phosphatase